MWDSLKSETGASISGLLAEPDRARRFSVAGDGMVFDYAKTAMTETARAGLLALAEARGVAERRDAMFEGALINETETRAVLHTALRGIEGAPVIVDGEDVLADVRATLTQMEGFATAVRSGTFAGQGGQITDVVNIGIGGSHLGPDMGTRALAPYHDGPRCHFVSNVDGADIHDTLCGLDPGRTLVIVASKTFTTIETMTNARTARDWMAGAVDAPAEQFVAVSSALDRTAEFGIAPERVFGFADCVGGRYSLWGPIGLPLMIAVGPADFRAFLSGGADMDAHFCKAPMSANMPVILALTGVWHHQVCGY